MNSVHELKDDIADSWGLNPQQKRAVESRAQALLIVAGAGTGKTKTLTCRIAYQIARGVDPATLCAVTFTNKAAREMEERVAGLLSRQGIAAAHPGAQKKLISFLGTFHGLGASILRRQAAHVGRNPNFVIYDSSDVSQLVKKILKSRSSWQKEKDIAKPGAITERISMIKNERISHEALRASQTTLEDQILVSVYDDYERALQEHNAFDFDDLLAKPVAILKHNSQVRAQYQARFRHLFVDEYQDINALQFALIRLLAGETGTITAVGDDAQTIYSWRGSDIELFLNFEKEFPGAEVVFLEENYRSHAIVLEAAGQVIAKNEAQKKKNLWTSKGRGQLIRVFETPDEESEGGAVVERIQNILKSGTGAGTIAVLYRTNAQSRPIEQGLYRCQIPYQVYGGLKFYERREIKDIVCALRMVGNPADPLSRERLEKNIGKTRLRAFTAGIDQAAGLHPSDLIKKFIEATGYLDYAEQHLTNIRERRENIEELIRFSELFSGLDEFLEQASLVQAHDDTAEKQEGTRERARVQLMTLHLAKGLEFDYVFIVGVQEGFLPHVWSSLTKKEIEEERRLFYVGITRARGELFLFYHGQPSRFLFEIKPEIMEFSSLGTSWRPVGNTDEEQYITFD